MIIPFRRIIMVASVIFVLGVFLTAQIHTTTRVNFKGATSEFLPQGEFGEVFIRITGDRYVRLTPVPVLVGVLLVTILIIISYASFVNSREFRYFVDTALFLAGFEMSLGRTGRELHFEQLQIGFDKLGRPIFTIAFPCTKEASKFGLVATPLNEMAELTRENSALQVTLLQVHRYLEYQAHQNL